MSERIVGVANADTRRTGSYTMEAGSIVSIWCNGKRWQLLDPIEVQPGDGISVDWDDYGPPRLKVTTARCSASPVTCSVGRSGE